MPDNASRIPLRVFSAYAICITALLLLPLLTGMHRAHHGEILRKAGKLAEQNQLKPLLVEQRFGLDEIADAYDVVAKGSKGKVIIEH